MNIKVGDIVEYHGTHARVMRIEDDYNGAHIAELAAREFNEYVPINELTLIKSVQLSEFEPGDLVIVHDIPTYEKDNYTCLLANIGKVVVVFVDTMSRSNCSISLLVFGTNCSISSRERPCKSVIAALNSS